MQDSPLFSTRCVRPCIHAPRVFHVDHAVQVSLCFSTSSAFFLSLELGWENVGQKKRGGKKKKKLQTMRHRPLLTTGPGKLGGNDGAAPPPRRRRRKQKRVTCPRIPKPFVPTQEKQKPTQLETDETGPTRQRPPELAHLPRNAAPTPHGSATHTPRRHRG
jgi:hypothetical protein